jgi:hypothetical protein
LATTPSVEVVPTTSPIPPTFSDEHDDDWTI